jgi:hypothetical protein
MIGTVERVLRRAVDQLVDDGEVDERIALVIKQR